MATTNTKAAARVKAPKRKTSTSTTKRPKVGRPPKPLAERRTAGLTLRLHADERADLESAAQRFGVSVTRLLLDAVREKLARAAR